MNTRPLCFTLMLLVLATTRTQAFEPAEPNWYGRPVLAGPERAQVQARHILERPYRPFHFYGNAVRRRHYRGSALPAPRDALRGTFSLFRDF